MKLQPTFTNQYNYKALAKAQVRLGGVVTHNNLKGAMSGGIQIGGSSLAGQEINRGAINLIDNSSGDEAPDDHFETQRQSSFYIQHD